MRVDLVYDADCPNIAGARAELVRAFVAAKAAPSWREHCRHDDVELAAHLEGYGSPSVLVDGRDVTGEAPGGGRVCRVYAGGGRTPPREAIVAAIRNAALVETNAAPAANAALPPGDNARRAWLRLGAALPSFTLALLPKVACPACWPLYAGVLGSLGLGFLVRSEILLPLTILFLTGTLASFVVGARRRRGYGPALLGAGAATALLAGKFALELDSAVHVAVGLLLAASFWNVWPRRSGGKSCAACVPSTEPTKGTSP